jgi:hypothetical protein
MAGIIGAVYDPPRSGLPYLAVALAPDGEVLAARAAPSGEAAEAFLETIFSEFAAARGLKAVRR